MSAGLHIPQAAYNAASRATDPALTPGLQAMAYIDAAAPLTVSVELHRIADELTDQYRSSGAAIQMIRERADELDPDGAR